MVEIGVVVEFRWQLIDCVSKGVGLAKAMAVIVCSSLTFSGIFSDNRLDILLCHHSV